MGAVVQTTPPTSPVSGQLWLDTTDDSDPTMGGLIADTGWHVIGGAGEPAFTNSWTNYGAGWSTAAFRRVNGVVHLRGLIASGTVGSGAFVLPAGYRSTQQLLLGTVSNSAAGRVDIYTNGTVLPQSPSSSTWVALDGLVFMADA
jgi:hypothetical protein